MTSDRQDGDGGLADVQAVHDELEAARAAFHRLVEGATQADLCRASAGTRWTNDQLLFHMLFGYLIARALLVLARLFARLPTGASRGFVRLLDAATGPFDVVNYYGSCAGARFIGRRRMVATLDRVIASLHRQLAAETDAGLRRGMYYPVRWDPFFKDLMTLADIYHYPTQHFSFHQ
ncbi:MAG TPA: DinB family protein, partial [Streptosporangiaceae bacterium]|nr:DinB family protein [Streptosporangiaceae bacterium]